MARARLCAEPFSPEALLAGFLEGRAGDGAVVSFVGLARAAGLLGPLAEAHIEQRGESIASVQTPFRMTVTQALIVV